MLKTLSDRQRIELAIPSCLLLAFSSVPGAFTPSDPSQTERAETDISSLRTQLRDVSLEPFADLAPKKQAALLRRLERVAKGEVALWKDQPAILVVLKLWVFIENLIRQQILILWEGSVMDIATRKLFAMSKHGFDDPERVAEAYEHATHMLNRLQKDGLYLSARIVG